MRLTIAATASVLVFSSLGFPQSLGDLARKERERREMIKNESKPITNTDAPRYKGGPITTVSYPPGASMPVDEKPGPTRAAAGRAADDKLTDLLGRPESFWRQTMSEARERVEDLKNEANVLTLKLAGLQTRFYAESDGFRQQQMQREMQKTIYEQEVSKENLARAQTRLRELDTEARKSGALPGWLRARNP